MDVDPFSRELLAFVHSTVKSVWSLELLLLMRRESGRAWSSNDLIRELRASPSVVTEALESLSKAALVRCDGAHFSYRPATPELDALVRELSEAYAARPVSVIATIIEARSGKLQDFANAFRIKKRD